MIPRVGCRCNQSRVPKCHWPVEYMIQWLNCSSIEIPCLGSSTFLWSDSYQVSTASSSILAPKLDKMSGLGFQMHSKFPSHHRQVIIPSLISCIFVIISQFALAMVPRYFSFSPLLVQLSLSAILLLFITGLGRICRRLVRVYASAPALVFFNILFIWGFHLSVIRKAIPLVTDIVFNVECALLMVGLRSILYRDPGRVLCGDSTSGTFIESEITQVIAHSEEEELSPTGICLEQPRLIMDENVLTRRMRYCKSCKVYIRGYDHHCPAFGNCIGKKKHVLFMVLLIGFVMVETSYVVSTNQFITKSWIMDKTMLETSLLGNLVISTMLFSLLQVIWQVIFLTWHIYCICVNIRTDEWVNWKKYPEFQHVQSQPGQSFPAKRFTNPYNKGVINNIKELLLQR